jgi:hypothetical protein
MLFLISGPALLEMTKRSSVITDEYTFKINEGTLYSSVS